MDVTSLDNIIIMSVHLHVHVSIYTHDIHTANELTYSMSMHLTRVTVFCVCTTAPGKTLRSSDASLTASAASTVLPKPAIPCTTTQLKHKEQKCLGIISTHNTDTRS